MPILLNLNAYYFYRNICMYYSILQYYKADEFVSLNTLISRTDLNWEKNYVRWSIRRERLYEKLRFVYPFFVVFISIISDFELFVKYGLLQLHSNSYKLSCSSFYLVHLRSNKKCYYSIVTFKITISSGWVNRSH